MTDRPAELPRTVMVHLEVPVNLIEGRSLTSTVDPLIEKINQAFRQAASDPSMWEGIYDDRGAVLAKISGLVSVDSIEVFDGENRVLAAGDNV